MIKLENVSTRGLIEYVGNRRRIGLNFEYIYRLLSMNKITDYQKLYNLLKLERSELQNMVQTKDFEVDYELVFKFLTDELSRVINKIEDTKIKEFVPEIFTFDNYINTNIDDKTLDITDNKNYGSILLYTIPLQIYGSRLNTLKKLSIAEIKHLLSHVDDYNFQNCLMNKRNFGKITGKRLVDAIDFYEQQVLRQANETDEREINLFALNDYEKVSIVESQIKEIAEYIIDNASECVWGKLTDTQKKRIMSAVLSTRKGEIEKDKWAFIGMVSNYTTLSELEQGVVKNKTLNRFIIR